MLDKLNYKLKKFLLKTIQHLINRVYKKEGLSDFVLKKQVELNSFRNEMNIPDEENFIYEDFVQ